MKTITLKAPAKINLYLDVLGKREDGYHEIESIAQSITFYDILSFEKIKKGIEIVCPNLDISEEKENLVYKAVKLFFDFTGISPGVRVILKKKIPLGAGLGGGSSDAATTLLALNELFDAKISLSSLLAISSKIGTDVPFCVMRGTALLKGKGEKIYPLPSLKEGWVVLVYPNIKISTSWAYSQIGQNFQKGKIKESRLKIENLKKGIEKEQLKGIREILYNRLEEVVIEEYPLIGEIKKELIKRGAKGALMSGSGSTVFALSESKKEAEKLKKHLQGKGTIYIAQPTDGKSL
ncbi:MAG TPA: 4-(cytidine 5'-diphospho)-2-C-methyl-D-erythritol kinase [Candidatus Aerophobetes bacterium]|uniref:4-diphosphocytidyl-2-C-methyl-D-erythritol kinase n=1 Tax=Aerophobetes bacterium TaxID=2030807 RepID=A0A7V5I1U3_UNCAE|nr:4-(cytidine 5'-diphospho)-2-C-methyl-D-erythritol kinase [Candidatus Aerophobetes bacterium]